MNVYEFQNYKRNILLRPASQNYSTHTMKEKGKSHVLILYFSQNTIKYIQYIFIGLSDFGFEVHIKFYNLKILSFSAFRLYFISKL